MEKVLTELDANFLTAAALGYSCLVYDYGSRDRKREAPRALWYGLEFVRFALNSLWFGAPVGMTLTPGGGIGMEISLPLSLSLSLPHSHSHTLTPTLTSTLTLTLTPVLTPAPDPAREVPSH